MKLTITKKGVQYVLKTCPGCGDEWYAKRKQNKCTLCGTGLVMRTKENQNLNWDEVAPEVSKREFRKMQEKAGLIGIKLQ